MTDKPSPATPTQAALIAEIDALSIEYPEFDRAPFAIVGQGLLGRMKAALVAAEEREQELRDKTSALAELVVEANNMRIAITAEREALKGALTRLVSAIRMVSTDIGTRYPALAEAFVLGCEVLTNPPPHDAPAAQRTCPNCGQRDCTNALHAGYVKLAPEPPTATERLDK